MIISRIHDVNSISKELLLLADPDLDKIEKYICNAAAFGFINNDEIIAAIILNELSNDVIEIKNISVKNTFQKKRIRHKIVETFYSFF